MTLLLNGELIRVPDRLTVAELLANLGVPRTGVAVERNREIVPKSLYDTLMLDADDQIEIVEFVGGG